LLTAPSAEEGGGWSKRGGETVTAALEWPRMNRSNNRANQIQGPPFFSYCYTLNTTGSKYGYGPGRKVSVTRHTVLGRHTETGQPTALGLGSGQPTLRHQEVPGPSTSADRESASAATEEDNLGGHHKKDKQLEGNGNARSCESRSWNRSGVVSRDTAQRNNTTSRESLYRCRRPGA